MTRQLLLLLLLSVVLMTGCAEDPATQPDSRDTGEAGRTAEFLARELVAQAGWVTEEAEDAAADLAIPQCRPLQSVEFVGRHPIEGDIAHYEWRVRLGSGPFDQIGLHRVVRERHPHRPIRTAANVFMLHGDLKDFEGCFMPGLFDPGYPAGFGVAVYLAGADIDVWGMDQAWCLVPPGVTDPSFMAGWGMEKHVEDTNAALTLARIVRTLTGSGCGKLNLLGYSGGGALALAVANGETQRPHLLRNVGGLIPVDQGLATDDPAWRSWACGTVANYDSLIAAGEHGEMNVLPIFGIPARDDPDGDSELIPGFTNLQAGLALAVYPFAEGVPSHFAAGVFDQGVPTGLQYTNVDLWISFMCNAPPFMPNAFSRDEYLSNCSLDDAPWARHLGRIEVPVCYVEAAGGFGELFESTLGLLGSSDITIQRVQLHPPEEAELDFGHIDLFIADNTAGEWWEAMKGWILIQAP